MPPGGGDPIGGGIRGITGLPVGAVLSRAAPVGQGLRHELFVDTGVAARPVPQPGPVNEHAHDQNAAGRFRQGRCGGSQMT